MFDFLNVKKMQPTGKISPYEDRRLRYKTLKISVYEGILAVVVMGLYATFYIPYLNHLGATKLQVGMAMALPAFVMGIVQFFTPSLFVRIKSYKFVLIYGLLFYSFCLIPFAFSSYIATAWPVWFAITMITVASVASAMIMAVWQDWISYIVPAKRRGKYFAMKSRLMTVCQIIVAVIAGLMLDKFSAKIMTVFVLIWLSCFVLRTISALTFFYHYEPAKIHQTQKRKIGFKNFMTEYMTGSYGKFVLAVAATGFCMAFYQPFLAGYIIDDLKYSYTLYSIFMIVPAVVSAIVVGYWGKICDKIGYVVPMKIAIIGFVCTPILLAVCEKYWLLIIVQIIIGSSSVGFALAAFSYLISISKPEDRLCCISYTNGVNFTIVATGAVLGGVLAESWPVILNYQSQTIFLVAAVILMLPVILLWTLTDDKPKKQKLSTVDLFFSNPKLSLKFGSVISGLRRLKKW